MINMIQNAKDQVLSLTQAACAAALSLLSTKRETIFSRAMPNSSAVTDAGSVRSARTVSAIACGSASGLRPIVTENSALLR